MIFHATAETAAAFLRPWFREPEKRMLPQDSTQKQRLRKPADKARAGSDGEKAQGADKAFVER
jgi:hypothetical protein